MNTHQDPAAAIAAIAEVEARLRAQFAGNPLALSLLDLHEPLVDANQAGVYCRHDDRAWPCPSLGLAIQHTTSQG